MSAFPKYPSIVLLDKRPELFAVKEVIATEKLHGSNFRIHFPMGMTSVEEVRFGSHEVDYEPGKPFPLGSSVAWWKARPDKLQRMWEVIQSYGYPEVTVFGEAYGPGIKAKGVKYSTGQEPLFRAFGVMVHENFLTYDLFSEVAGKMELPVVHVVWRGEPTRESLDALLEQPSAEAILNGIVDENNLAEGIVIQSNPLLRNVFGEWLIAKHKSRRFSEVAHAPAPSKEKVASPADAFVATYVTEGRVLNAVGRITDNGGTLVKDMRDMPVVLEAVLKDLHKECEPEWLALGLPESALKSALSRVLGPLYRRMLGDGSL